MSIAKKIRDNQGFNQAYRKLKSKLSKGSKLGKASRFIHKQAQKHMKQCRFYCSASSYLLAVTNNNCYFRRKNYE